LVINVLPLGEETLEPIPSNPPSEKNGFDRPWTYGLALAGIFGLALVLRLPLWTASGPGRDEAAYHYWAHHPEPGFAPLVQAAVRFFEMFGSCSLWTLRAPVILLGLLVLYLNDRRLRGSEASWTSRLLALAVLAFTPWQSFAGSILHPDNFLLASVLAVMIAAQQRRVFLMVLATWAAVLAKQTGVLMVPVVWWLAGRVITARLLLILIPVGLFLTINRDLVAGISEFGRLSPTLTPLSRLETGGWDLLFLGGPLLLALPVMGARQRWNLIRRKNDDGAYREAKASLAAAGIILAFFLTAALFRGQFKGNWILPAFVLLWPLHLPTWPRPVLMVGLALTVMGSLGQAAIFRHPGLMEGADRALEKIRPGQKYSSHASVREGRVSSSRTWSQHFAQYEDISLFCLQLAAGWNNQAVEDKPLKWIVSDDYGLACQVAWYLNHPNVCIVIPDDGIFHRTVQSLTASPDPGEVMVLAVRKSPEKIWDQLVINGPLPSLTHPVTGQILVPYVGQTNFHGDRPCPVP
jgi:hypothetical protein